MKIIHWIYCLFLTACHFIYTVAYPSLINGERYLGSSDKILEPSYIHAFFLSRIKFGEFARRPLTTWLIQFLENLGFTLDMAFIVVEYSGLFIAFVLLFKLTMNILKHEKFAYASVIVFASSFWVYMLCLLRFTPMTSLGSMQRFSHHSFFSTKRIGSALVFFTFWH